MEKVLIYYNNASTWARACRATEPVQLSVSDFSAPFHVQRLEIAPNMATTGQQKPQQREEASRHVVEFRNLNAVKPTAAVQSATFKRHPSSPVSFLVNCYPAGCSRFPASFSMYLSCVEASSGFVEAGWTSLSASYRFRLEHATDASKSVVLEAQQPMPHVFTKDRNNWGIHEALELSRLGEFISNGTLRVTVEFDYAEDGPFLNVHRDKFELLPNCRAGDMVAGMLADGAALQFSDVRVTVAASPPVAAAAAAAASEPAAELRLDCHRVVLAAASKPLAAMLSSPMQEGQAREIVLRDVPASTVETMVRWIYGCRDLVATLEQMVRLWALADCYDLGALSAACMETLLREARLGSPVSTELWKLAKQLVGPEAHLTRALWEVVAEEPDALLALLAPPPPPVALAAPSELALAGDEAAALDVPSVAEPASGSVSGGGGTIVVTPSPDELAHACRMLAASIKALNKMPPS